MKLAIVSSITEIHIYSHNWFLVVALDKLETKWHRYYTHGLLYNDFVAASTNGAFVYNPQDTKEDMLMNKLT
jgi:hypothetical protein